MVTPVQINGRDLKPHKATTNASLDSRNVLTDRPWQFVDLWLKRERKEEALFYWNQARIFADAAYGMPVESSPLLHYYSFMNATKALLTARGVSFNPYHGVRSHNMRGNSNKITLSNEGVSVQNHGIVPALSQLLGETEHRTIHSLEDLLFNIPCIHRTYCLTYKSQTDLFIPLRECVFVYDSGSGTAYLTARLSKNFIGQKFIRRLPNSFLADNNQNGEDIRSSLNVAISSPVISNSSDLSVMEGLQRSLRSDLNYIAGAQTLWYVKSNIAGPKRIQRSPLTLTLMAMHRLSEICRYRPIELSSFLAGQKNWLLTEFVQVSPRQFIDELASELTGFEFMMPNVRPAT